MRVTRYRRGYTIRLTEHEMAVLRNAWSLNLHDRRYAYDLWTVLSSSERRALAQRKFGWPGFLATDEDRTPGEEWVCNI